MNLYILVTRDRTYSGKVWGPFADKAETEAYAMTLFGVGWDTMWVPLPITEPNEHVMSDVRASRKELAKAIKASNRSLI